MSFRQKLNGMDTARMREQLTQCDGLDVERVLSQPRVDSGSVHVLFSPAARPFLETMAQHSVRLTRQRFGPIINLYVPLYLSNECVNNCSYCGFNRKLNVPGKTLTPQQVKDEARLLRHHGFRHILLVSGESRTHVSLHYLKEIVGFLNRDFDSISIEIGPLSYDEYSQLAETGVDGLTLYQETYDPDLYATYHGSGPKKNFAQRLEHIEYGGLAGFRSLGIGVLLGLNDWRWEAVMLALHGRYLAKHFWKSRISVSFPRICSSGDGYQPPYTVTDADLVQMICAMRLILPDAELVISTREKAHLRDNLIGLGITRMSAGSRTNPGGYGTTPDTAQQFEVEDCRSPSEVAEVIRNKGFDPVWKDFDRTFMNV